MTQILKKKLIIGIAILGLAQSLEGNSNFLKLAIKIIEESIDPAQTYFKTANHWLQWDRK